MKFSVQGLPRHRVLSRVNEQLAANGLPAISASTFARDQRRAAALYADQITAGVEGHLAALNQLRVDLWDSLPEASAQEGEEHHRSRQAQVNVAGMILRIIALMARLDGPLKPPAQQLLISAERSKPTNVERADSLGMSEDDMAESLRVTLQCMPGFARKVLGEAPWGHVVDGEVADPDRRPPEARNDEHLPPGLVIEEYNPDA